VSENETIQAFLGERKLAVAGASRSARKFGTIALKELRGKGYQVFAVNPHAKEVAGQPCYASLAELPETVGGVFIAVPRAECERVVRDAAACGIRRVWIQQGCDTPEALAACEEAGVAAVSKRCILMFAGAHGIHGIHRWLWGLLGKLPA
jgi:predicted CoA-binding protein